ncbi:MAG TPA: protein kinase, partial [Polyangiaceae bacterium]|nr:protein kinase [Polyangiaceae bacterium]
MLEQIGKGGNGQVYRACFGAEVAALKLLHKHDRVQRFRDEVSCMKRLVGTQGVLPVIDSYIPDAPTKMDPAWFVMPLATPLLEEIGDLAAPVEVVKAIRAFALVLASLHGKGFSHRDVKPDNLFKFGSDWVVGDFGLVDFDGKDHETALGERIGPMHFIAPEMLLARQPEDGKAADVYSLAKTLWVLLTGFRSPVPGGYDAASPTCQLRSYVTLPHSIELDRLIERCTTIEPLSRPTMEAFGEEVAEWLRMNDRNEQGAQAVGPLAPGNEWAEVVEAASRQELARTAHARLHNDTRATVDAFYAS